MTPRRHPNNDLRAKRKSIHGADEGGENSRVRNTHFTTRSVISFEKMN